MIDSAAKDELDLGDDYRIVFSEYEGEKRVGATVIHKGKDGLECMGWAPFEGRSWARSFENNITTWTVESDDPLTLSPSILCRVCGDHGFVRNGKWVPA